MNFRQPYRSKNRNKVTVIKIDFRTKIYSLRLTHTTQQNIYNLVFFTLKIHLTDTRLPKIKIIQMSKVQAYGSSDITSYKKNVLCANDANAF